MRPRFGPAMLLTVTMVSISLAPGPDGAAATPAAARRKAPSIALRVDQPLFSPNGDGRMDDTTITAEVDLPSTLEIQVVSSSGQIVRSWVEAATPSAPATVVWDGRTEDGQPADDGEHTIRAHDAGPAGISGEGSAAVAVDTRPPSFRWLGARPGWRRPLVRFRFRSGDASGPLAVRVDVDGVLDRAAEAEIDPGAGSMSWRSGNLFPGNYAVRFRIADRAGNVASEGPFPFVVERPMRGRTWSSVPEAGPRVALTIDDCHYTQAWARMLNTLRDQKAGATFFCPGLMIARNPGLARRTIRDGHAIGAHGWDHAALTTQPYAGVLRRLRLDAAALRRATGHTTAPYFRPPYGAVNRAVVRAAGQTSHPRVIMWDVDTSDWTSPGVGTIVSRAVRGAKRGSIILLHTKPQSAAALPAIISGLRDRGLEPVGLPELFAARGGTKRRR